MALCGTATPATADATVGTVVDSYAMARGSIGTAALADDEVPVMPDAIEDLYIASAPDERGRSLAA
jgi:hypothetical protein